MDAFLFKMLLLFTTIVYFFKKRIENGFNTAEMVGVVEGFIDDTGELYYRECEPRKFIFGGNFTLTEFKRELISMDAPKAKTRRL